MAEPAERGLGDCERTIQGHSVTPRTRLLVLLLMRLVLRADTKPEARQPLCMMEGC